VPTLVVIIALSWALGALMHWWPRLPTRWRRLASISSSAAGLGFLVAGTASEGLRETATTSMVVLGPAYLTGTASAAASLHYYVLTAVCLLLGFAGLTLGESLALWLREHWLISAVAVAWLVTVIRFLLERSAAPPALAAVVGVTWMAPIAGAWFATSLRDSDRRPRTLLAPLVAYAYLVRGFVALVAVLATRFQLGTHYDVSPLVEVSVALSHSIYTFAPGSAAQIFWLTLVPQLVVWPLFTVATGLAAGLLAWRWVPQSTRRRPAPLPVDVLASDDGR
jgi:hypothetical protein